MSAKKSTTLYRPFLREAFVITWKRKSLWIFGIFAALISTGGIMDLVWRTLQKVERTESLLENLSSASFIGYRVAASYIGQLATLGPERSSMILIAITLMGILLVIIATLSQGALILGIRAKDPQNPYTLRTQAASSFWSLFLIGTLNKILMGILIGLMTLPLWLISLSTVPAHIVVFGILMCVFLPATIIVNIIYMFALIDIVETHAHPLDAIHTGWRLFTKQWLAIGEYGILLFILVLAGSVILLALLTLLLVPYSILFTVAVLTGSFPVFLLFNSISASLLIGMLLMFGGASVTFQYSAWYKFYQRGLHKTHGKKAFSKILRLMKT
ncbi:MAG: hypothetical protein UY76_C0008G0021 [Candidatus Uhrbacteria bacterium GW2011_GWA2_52_8d]|uniref:Glycerophosphoryl diester phosphodiesterase membrane domain-containing protein n=1 Tax=Candidatus Uhrbacteria bacterium GW2011_GWA2_52_8d TaxID=1618979 RepID=A0A0G1XPJ8_9BACT|nr:MAG: hypothetical protein UY76_C0008G0021 [Candidatus Uhrbacteria bacterium GW2011_GWA2_52_8d]